MTITGPGGTGKTRLALQVAAELVGAFRDGVYWVPLAGLADAELVPAEIGQAVGARDELAEFARGRELLLLLDNFEHLLEAATAVAELLAAGEGVRVLATSRIPLRIGGERQYPLEPLASEDASTLFRERTRAVGGADAADEMVASICRRLDHLPLAIELAAARTKLLSPETLFQRLEHSLPVLTGGPRDAPERQRTLRATIEWSHALLAAPAKALFARAGVFAGGSSIEAFEQVCGADIDLIGTLVDASLLKPIGNDRLLLLDTIREYALEQLAESGEERGVRDRHASFFTRIAEDAYRGRLDDEASWARRLEIDHDNLRGALDHLAAAPERELELAGALGWFWASHAHLAEGTRRLEAALRRGSGSGPAGARALVAAGALAGQRGDGVEARRLLEEGIELWRAEGNDAETAAALDTLGWTLFFTGQTDDGLRAFEDSLELARRLADGDGERRALVGVCQGLVVVGEVERAEALSQTLLQLARTEQDLRSEHFAQHFLADCSLLRQDFERPEERYRESLRSAVPLGDVLETSFEVQGIAMAASGQRDAARAATLGAAVEACWEERGIGISVPFWDELLERYIGAARRQAGEAVCGTQAAYLPSRTRSRSRWSRRTFQIPDNGAGTPHGRRRPPHADRARLRDQPLPAAQGAMRRVQAPIRGGVELPINHLASRSWRTSASSTAPSETATTSGPRVSWPS